MVAPRRQLGWLVFLAVFALATPAPPAYGERALILATTTSVDNSGLLDHLRPQLAAQTGLEVHVVVRGTGAALRLGVSGDADVVFVHDRAAEDAFMAAGHGVLRRDVMTSDFLIVGPRSDPANIAQLTGPTGAAPALRRIAETETLFVSRGDSSGTHNAELALWRSAGIDPRALAGSWYRETGSGMGATLNIAAALDAHLLTESGTWTKFANRGALTVLVANALANPYGVMLVNPARHPHIPEADARKFIDWLTGADAQRAIDEFTIDGQHPFRSAAAASP
ncbi:MAG: solute-binding protein [Alphaproteobacteria bacterium]|nr:solute-binding protein [Alphaproteobacteria bacterium]